MLWGDEGLARLAGCTVAVLGLGGVGGHACDALARAGVGHLVLVDNDVVSVSNVNRQMVATLDTVGMAKVDVMAARIAAINPQCVVTRHRLFYLPETADLVDLDHCDYVVDAIDTVSAKVELAVRCASASVPLIAALGCGNRMDPTKLVVGDLYDTQGDPLAKVLRRELRPRGIAHLTVVCSTEAPNPIVCPPETTEAHGRHIPASTPFVPAAAGILLAAHVVRSLLGK